SQVAEAPERPRVPEFTCQVAGCCEVFDALHDYEHHYHTLHGNVCSFCRRAFPSGHLLDAHILEWHDSLFQILSERQDMYQCLVEGCTEKFKTSKARKDHLVKLHLYPTDFRFDKPQKGRGPAMLRGNENVAAEPLGDDREQSEGEAMEVCCEPTDPSPAPEGGRWTYSHRLFLITSLVAMLLQEASMAPAPQVPVKFQVRLRAPEQDTEKAWGTRVLALPEKGLLPILKLKVLAVEKKLPGQGRLSFSPLRLGTKAWVEPEDILGHVRSPLQDPEPDHDSLYHSLTEDQGGTRPWLRALPSHQVLRGPEEDRDHIYHPA
uniref:C2H2-type domain-containing protein n=1 Tax=Otolemur garnettii TaxID=30611 RepID=H0WGU5_OTOGA